MSIERNNPQEYLKKINVCYGFLGVPGSGKSTLAKVFAERVNASITEEKFRENPFLARFYEDPKRWAFHSQTFFGKDAIISLSGKDSFLRSLCQDPAGEMHKDGYAKTIFEMGWMNKDEYELYKYFWDTLSEKRNIRKPDVYIATVSPFETLKERIIIRGRPYELLMLERYPEYLVRLQKKVSHWKIEHPGTSVLFVDTSKVDFTKLEKSIDSLMKLEQDLAELLKQK